MESNNILIDIFRYLSPKNVLRAVLVNITIRDIINHRYFLSSLGSDKTLELFIRQSYLKSMKLVSNKLMDLVERTGSSPTILVFNDYNYGSIRVIIGTSLMRIYKRGNDKTPEDFIYDCNSSIVTLGDKLLFMRGRILMEYDYKKYRRSEISFTNSSIKKQFITIDNDYLYITHETVVLRFSTNPLRLIEKVNINKEIKNFFIKDDYMFLVTGKSKSDRFYENVRSDKIQIYKKDINDKYIFSKQIKSKKEEEIITCKCFKDMLCILSKSIKNNYYLEFYLLEGFNKIYRTLLFSESSGGIPENKGFRFPCVKYVKDIEFYENKLYLLYEEFHGYYLTIYEFNLD